MTTTTITTTTIIIIDGSTAAAAECHGAAPGPRVLLDGQMKIHREWAHRAHEITFIKDTADKPALITEHTLLNPRGYHNAI